MRKTSNIDPRIQKWIQEFDGFDDDNCTYVLVAPLGSDESWGQTINGDCFSRWCLEDESDQYGYRTFMSDARAYMHHRNTDPRRSFGDFPISVFNKDSDRVEAVWRLFSDQASTIPGARRVIDAYRSGQDFPISMGCFLAGQLVTMADGTVKPIEGIKVGDMVLTHKGRARRVTELHIRPYEGDVYSIRGESGNVIRCTEGHPFWVVDMEQTHTADANPRWRDFGEVKGQWVEAKCMHPARFLGVQPVPSEVLTPDWATRSLARLLGYYLAEGHVVRNKNKEICGVEFTVHEDDAFMDEIDELAEAVWSRNEPSHRRRENSPEALSVSIFDAKLAQRLYELGGSYAHHKCLDKGVMLWHPDLQREILGAFINGDGHSPRSGAVQWSTASRNLCFQLVQICHRIGLAPSIQSLTHKAGSGFSRTNTREWITFLGKTYAQTLRDVCAKIDEVPVTNPQRARRFSNQGLLTPLREMSRLWMRTQVYNFEVEEDNSYVVEGLAVHNCKVPWDLCSVCGHKAKTPDEYCIHPHDPGFGHVYPEDHPEHALVLVRVFNPWPKFVDLSGVGINAAPEATPLGWIFPELIAHMKAMTKTSAARGRGMIVVPSAYLAAYHNGINSGMPSFSKHSMGALKVSDMIKHIPVLGSQVINPVINKEDDLEDDKIEGMLKTCAGARGVMSNLGALGVVLSPREFRALLMKDQGLPRSRWPDVAPSEVKKGFCEGGAEFVDVNSLRGVALIKGIPLVPKRSILYPHMARRAVVHRCKEALPPMGRRGIEVEINISAGPTVGLLYGKYLRDLAINMGKLVQELLSSFPEVGDDLVNDGQPSRILGASGTVKQSELAAQALIPSAYVLSKASCLDRYDLLMESVEALNQPGVAHLFGGVFAGEP